MKETITKDDLTHEIIDADRVVSVEVMMGDRTGTFEATQETQDAVAALLFDHDPSKVMKLLGIAAAPTAPHGKTVRSRNGDGDSSNARAWCKTPEGKAAAGRLGATVPDKGRMPKQLIEAWREAAMQ